MENLINKLGKAKIDQTSINASIDIKKINNLFLLNKDKIENFLKKNEDNEVKNLWNIFFKENYFNFPINKTQEIYIINNSTNLKKIFDYINFRYLFYLCGSKKINIGYPPHLLIEPVSTCNLRCPFCFQTDKTFTRKPFMGVMEFDFFKKIVDEADQLGIGAVTLASRGEPTLHKNLKDMLKYLGTKKNIHEIKLNTNATFLNTELAHEIFKNKISQVVISADHYEKEKFEKLRKNSNFEKIVNNVDNLYKIRENYTHSNTEIRISGIEFNENTNKEKFHQFWIKRSDHVTLGKALERWDTYNNTIDEKTNDPCETLWDRMYVWFDGKVNPCDADYKSYLSYGNLKKNSIKEVWQSTIISKTRCAHLNNERKNIDPCNKCGITFIK
jgi:radical SAM protein with 4Fe4S-binding SPASM domain